MYNVLKDQMLLFHLHSQVASRILAFPQLGYPAWHILSSSLARYNLLVCLMGTQLALGKASNSLNSHEFLTTIMHLILLGHLHFRGRTAYSRIINLK